MLAEVGGCHHEVWLCTPRIPIPAGPLVGKTSQGARASLASPGQGSDSFQGSTKPGPRCLRCSEVELGGQVPGTHTPCRLSLMCGVKWGETLGPV